jgi:hypothetical protein
VSPPLGGAAAAAGAAAAELAKTTTEASTAKVLRKAKRYFTIDPFPAPSGA